MNGYISISTVMEFKVDAQLISMVVGFLLGLFHEVLGKYGLAIACVLSFVFSFLIT